MTEPRPACRRWAGQQDLVRRAMALRAAKQDLVRRAVALRAARQDAFCQGPVSGSVSWLSQSLSQTASGTQRSEQQLRIIFRRALVQMGTLFFCVFVRTCGLPSAAEVDTSGPRQGTGFPPRTPGALGQTALLQEAAQGPAGPVVPPPQPRGSEKCPQTVPSVTGRQSQRTQCRMPS